MEMQSYADKINAHLEAGGSVQVSTHSRATLYRKKHAGYFRSGKGQSLYVRSGKRFNCLVTESGIVLVHISMFA
jgi:hypothetical protein